MTRDFLELRTNEFIIIIAILHLAPCWPVSRQDPDGCRRYCGVGDFTSLFLLCLHHTAGRWCHFEVRKRWARIVPHQTFFFFGGISDLTSQDLSFFSCHAQEMTPTS